MSSHVTRCYFACHVWRDIAQRLTVHSQLLRRVEKEEERMAFQDESKQRIHTVILNLVIGTLYCSKGNFEFGISRIIKSFDRSVGAGQTT